MVIFFLMGMGDTRMGRDGNRKRVDISESHIAKELYLDLEAGRKASRNVVLLRPMLRIFYSFSFLSYLLGRNDITGQTLSPPRRLQHQCVEFFHNLVLIAGIGSGLYFATIVTSGSNADTRLISLYLQTLKNAHEGDWCRQACVRKNVTFISYSYVIYNCKKVDKYFQKSRKSNSESET